VSFEFIPTSLEGVLRIKPFVYEDERGIFLETYRSSAFEAAGLGLDFVQQNHSRSHMGVLRGLHYQRPPYGQAKLIRVIRGRVWDVVVDLRSDSASYGRWEGHTLYAQDGCLLYVPEGFAHGFLALEEGSELLYACSAEYRPESEAGVRWNDPELSIPWPLREVIVSARDAALPFLKDIR